MRKLVNILTIILALLAPLPASRVAPRRELFSASARQAQQDNSEELPRGQLVEKVQTKHDAAQTYALYLPSNYTPARKWPILYAFDPMARGRVPVERFRAAAERYGWVVAGSNNSRNGPIKDALAAVAAVWDDTHARFNLDERRVYATGFSGGARVAVRLNYLCRNCLAGVIACGGGFPADIAPDSSTPFALFSMAGTDDYNFPELKRLDKTFDKLSLPHRLGLFEGGHAWAPAELCAEAVEWMELQAIRTGRRARDEALLEELWNKTLTRARADETSKKFYEAYANYQSLASDFRGLRDASEAEAKAAELRKTKEVRKALDNESGELLRQQKITRELSALLAKRNDPEEGALAAADFRKIVADLKKTSRGEQDSSERRVARRSLNQLFAQVHEAVSISLRARREIDSRAVSQLEIAAEIASDNPHVQLELARAYALNKERRKALEALKRAVEKGFKDARALETDEAFAPLRNEAAYKELVESLAPKR